MINNITFVGKIRTAFPSQLITNPQREWYELVYAVNGENGIIMSERCGYKFFPLNGMEKNKDGVMIRTGEGHGLSKHDLRLVPYLFNQYDIDYDSIPVIDSAEYGYIR